MIWSRTCALALAFASRLATVCADLAETYPVPAARDWEVNSAMQMSVSASEGDVVPLFYAVIPLTTTLGLNQSQISRGRVNIDGRLTLADATTYPDISGADVIPYLCCDQLNNSFIQPDDILNHLMSNSPQPAAILLYSQQGQCCGLTGQNLNFHRLLTMSDVKSASQIENITTSAAGNARATITGNFTDADMDQDQDQSQGGSNPAVAMSILYSITGLITLLFLIIIATGAIRAHRYPERYGPRAGLGGRPRQSRAKGLARAVLETLPIVKFGDPPRQTKPDPDHELESAASEPRDTPDVDRQAPRNNSERHLSTIPESPTEPTPRLEATGALGTSNQASVASDGEENSDAPGANKASGAADEDEGLGCSICTEDFTIGEDVRVLPCNHKFHPQCVDPWLVNVSGTCPLCRLDLRPEQDENDQVNAGSNADVPPLDAEGNEAGGDSSNSTRRRSRFFDIARLRHAPVEERIEALRSMRTGQRQGSTASNEEENAGRARVTDRLRDRFHIRTRAAERSSAQTGSSSSGPQSASLRSDAV